jgi:hypothetical protein
MSPDASARHQDHKSIDCSQHVAGRHVLIQRKFVKQCRLIDLPLAHHETHSRLRCLSESALPIVHKLEFFNTNGQQRTLRRPLCNSARRFGSFGAKG